MTSAQYEAVAPVCCSSFSGLRLAGTGNSPGRNKKFLQQTQSLPATAVINSLSNLHYAIVQTKTLGGRELSTSSSFIGLLLSS